MGPLTRSGSASSISPTCSTTRCSSSPCSSRPSLSWVQPSSGRTLSGSLSPSSNRGRNKFVTTTLNGFVMCAWVMPEIVAGFVGTHISTRGGPWTASWTTLGSARTGCTRRRCWRSLSPTYGGAPPFPCSCTRPDSPTCPVSCSKPPRSTAPVQLALLRRVIIPLMRRSIMVNLMLITLQTLQSFTLIFVLTAGGPGEASMTTPLYIYQQAFQLYDISYGSAMCLVLLMLGALFSVDLHQADQGRGSGSVTSAITLGEGVKRGEVESARQAQVRRGRFRINSPRKTMSTICVYFVLALVAMFFIAPLLWIVLSSFEPAATMGTNAPLVLSFSNFAKVLNWINVLSTAHQFVDLVGVDGDANCCHFAVRCLPAVSLPDALPQSRSCTPSSSPLGCRSRPSWCLCTSCSPGSTWSTTTPP